MPYNRVSYTDFVLKAVTESYKRYTFRKNFHWLCQQSVNFHLDLQSFAYVLILNMLQVLLNRNDVWEKVFNPYDIDSTTYRQNDFLMTWKFGILLNLYTDEFEIASPLGTSKKEHKVFSVYWVFRQFS